MNESLIINLLKKFKNFLIINFCTLFYLFAISVMAKQFLMWVVKQKLFMIV